MNHSFNVPQVNDEEFYIDLNYKPSLVEIQDIVADAIQETSVAEYW